MNCRKEHELPLAIEKWGWKYHHLGIPTTLKLPGEQYIPHLKFHVSGFSSSPFGIEWMRFDSDCPLDKLIQTVPHLAFEVQNIAFELVTHHFPVLSPPNSPAEGIRVVMIEHNGAPIELIEFDNPFDYELVGESGTEISLKPIRDFENELEELKI